MWEVILLINCDVHLFDQDAIGWDSVSLIKVNNISDNNFSNWDVFNGTVSTSVNIDSLVVDFFSELQELSLFPPVAETRDKADEQKTGINGQRFHVSSSG